MFRIQLCFVLIHTLLGAEYVDEKVVVDGNLITSRIVEDLPFFTKAVIDQLL